MLSRLNVSHFMARHVNEGHTSSDMMPGLRSLPLRRIDAKRIERTKLFAGGAKVGIYCNRQCVRQKQLVDALIEVRRSFDENG